MTIFGHRNGSGGYRIYTGVPGGYWNPPEAIGPHGPNWWKRRGGQGAAARPSTPKSELDKEGGRRPPFLSPSLLPSPLLVQQGREGVLLPVGVGLLLARLLLAGRTSPLAPLYTGAEGTLDTTIDHLIF